MKCDIRKCHAACCYNVPISKSTLSAYRKRVINPIIRIESLGFDKELGGEQIMCYTSEEPSENKCPFLKDNCKCNIYVTRPIICRRFGTGEGFLNCEYLTGKKIDAERIKKAVQDMNGIEYLKKLTVK